VGGEALPVVMGAAVAMGAVLLVAMKAEM